MRGSVTYRVTALVVAAVGLLLVIVPSRLLAGGGPENVAVVVNAESWASLAIANEYVRLRQIPASNVISLENIPGYETISVDEFRARMLGPVLETIGARGLKNQIDYVAWSSDFPYAIDVSSDIKAAGLTLPKVLTPTASLNGLTYLHEQVMAKDPTYLELTTNGYMRRPVSPADTKAPTNDELVAIREANELVAQKKWSEAAERFSSLIEQRPHAALLHYNHACCLARLEKGDDAIDALRKATNAGWWDRAHAEKDDDLASLRDREDFKALLAEMQSPLFEVQPTLGFRSRDRWSPAGERVESGGRSYLLSMMLAVTSGRGTSVESAIEGLRRSAAADGTRPSGTVYFLKNGDIRSRTRERAFRAAAEQLRKLGVATEISDGVLPREKEDVAGAVIGIAAFDWSASQSRILPGAICEHLTSFGGVMRERSGQTPLSEFLKHGAAATSGTVTEPYAIQAKFPFPFLHVHYAAGCTAAEAFYQSVHGPYQLLIVGDPLCRPWARIPQVRLEGLPEVVTKNDQVSIRPRVAEGDGPVRRFELFLDGRRIAECGPSESLEVDSHKLAAGEHQLSVVAIADDPIETQGRHTARFRVAGDHQVTVGTDAVGRVGWNERLRIKAARAGAASISLRHNGRILATVTGDQGEIEVDPRRLGFGPVKLQAVAMTDEGEVAGAFLPFEIAIPSPLPASRTKEEGETAPGLLLMPADGAEPIVIEDTADGKWLGHLAGEPETHATLAGEFEAAATGLYQFQIRGNGKAEVRIDGTPVGSHDGAGWSYLPVALEKGLHTVDIKLSFESKPDLQIRFGREGTESLSGPRFRHSKSPVPGDETSNRSTPVMLDRFVGSVFLH